MRSIELPRFEIDQIVNAPAVADGYARYVEIMCIASSDASFFNNPKFRKCFVRFYRVRRGSDWLSIFFRLMEKAINEKLSFSEILQDLYNMTRRVEASFSSKLYATLNSRAPVIDSHVLKNLGLRLPKYNTTDRINKINQIYKEMDLLFSKFLNSDDGKYLVNSFHYIYPCCQATDVKILDFVLWQKSRVL